MIDIPSIYSYTILDVILSKRDTDIFNEGDFMSITPDP
jgi:hypothetical protein